MSKQQEALRLALEALEYWDVHGKLHQPTEEAITALREALAEQPAQGCNYCNHALYSGTKCKNCGRVTEQAAIKRDLTPEQPAQQCLHVSDSQFESWFSEYNPAGKGTKQQMREAYAAGMRDPLVQPAQQQEPYEIDWPEYHEHAMGCGLEDREEYCRYGAMRYGWDCAIEAVAQAIPNIIYTSPPAQRKPLTDEEITAISKQVAKGGPNDSIDRFVRAIEAKLREKNGGAA